MAAVFEGEGRRVEKVPDTVENETSGDGEKGSGKDEGEWMNGDIVPHERVEEKPWEAEAAEEVDGGDVLAAVGLKPECEKEKGGEKEEGVEVLKDPSERVRVGADEG